MSNGLLNACKKKNSLYTFFLKYRTKEVEVKYKKYKNKLTDIIRKCKQDYYNKLLDSNKNNTKGLWNILNSLITNKSRINNYPQYFREEDNIINNKNTIVNKFNKFFVDLLARILLQKLQMLSPIIVS